MHLLSVSSTEKKLLNKENRGPPSVNYLYAMYNFSHPSLVERLDAIEVEMKKKK